MRTGYVILSNHEKGELRERMLQEALARFKPFRWVRNTERASPHLDVKGIDAFVHVRYANNEYVAVPIQIKSHESDIDINNKEQAVAMTNGVIFIPISLMDSDVAICNKLYPLLKAAIKEDQGTKITEYVARLEKQTLNTSGQFLRKQIEDRRSWTLTRPKPRSANFLEILYVFFLRF